MHIGTCDALPFCGAVELRVGVRTDFLRGLEDELTGRTLRDAREGLSFCLCLFLREDEIVGLVSECTDGL